ncbi:MAG: class I SAM-dependent methyltransferase [Phycisphaerales bacterium]|nr:class I SAM-dependent methyltransferase [Phycisphaerales bacterium]
MTKATKAPATKPCNICDGKDLGPGPGGRMSYDGVSSPRCTACQSLERHRAFRSVFNQLKDHSFKNAKVLQFSTDRSNDARWFSSHEISEYEGDNPLDLQNIDRPNESYDIVVCNHVIEHVADDRAAMRELVRTAKDSGFVFLSFPDPLRLDKTNEWGYPDDTQHGHYRLYGKDVRQKFKEELPGVHVFAVTGTDPCTGSTEGLWLITASDKRAEWIQQQVPNAQRIDTGNKDQNPSERTNPTKATIKNPSTIMGRLLSPPAKPSRELAPNDNMGASNLDRYFTVGRDAMRVIGSAINRPGAQIPESVLDFACGWGRVARHLRASFPDAQMVCADVWKDAVDFTSKAFDAEPMQLSTDPNEYEITTKFDLIWCGSLITHLPEDRARRVIDMFANALNPNGVAVFTTHGRSVRHRKANNIYSYSVDDASTAIESFDNNKYGFAPYKGETNYGFSLTPMNWIVNEILQRPDMTQVQYSERAWDDHQDVVAIQRRSTTEPHRPITT